jgi:hypothetical protein
VGGRNRACTSVAISATKHDVGRRSSLNRAMRSIATLAVSALAIAPPFLSAQTQQPKSPVETPPLVRQARRFLQQRGFLRRRGANSLFSRPEVLSARQSASSTASTAIWQPLGPTAVSTPNFGLVTGRVSSIAIDPADATGNHVFIGTTGGGVWASQNAASSGNVVFSPLTDSISAFDHSSMASISIGALTVQPGGTGVVLAGTGDPNDALDSYYGAGVLRSSDGGNTWTVISHTADQIYSFLGEGFAGFAWSTVNPQLVVAAVSEAYEGTLVDAPLPSVSNAGLYYSADAGVSWSLATITDGPGADVEGPLDSFTLPNGNSVTAVVWNPVRQLFVAAVRFHGYYQSTDGITWTRMPAQPGPGLTKQLCPNNPHSIGSIACPAFRGALAVNPLTGDTFAWTVDLFNQDQGLWQDTCAISGGHCANQTVTFTQRWSTVSLQSDTSLGAATIPNGDYNFTLAAVPSAQDTLLFAGTNDLWKCSLAMGCIWRNTTNANTCRSARVAPYQHSLDWNPQNPQEILVGNDSGLWRSMDAAGETGSVCSISDAAHFQSLNSGLGSLAEVASISQVGSSPCALMAGLGVNGTAGVKNSSGPTTIWPQIIAGEGGPVAIDPASRTNWYVNNSAGVSIYRCSGSDDCTPAAFGASPVIDNSDVSGDGYKMALPAPFIVDPVDSSQLLVGTCRMWRGPADGTRWTGANVISPMLDGVSGSSSCSGDALIRSIAARPTPGGEVIYVGMYGRLDGGGIRAGHVLKATWLPGDSSLPTWQDLALNPVSNDQVPFNYYGLDISSIFVDPHDSTGNTVYVTITGIPDSLQWIRSLYRTTDGGAHWFEITSNLVRVPANGVVIDPQDANTAYVATDMGVYVTRQVGACVYAPSNCWSAFGAGLPLAPVVQLSASPSGASPDVLVAATYGRGIWQIPLLTAGTQLTTAAVQPASIDFAAQSVGTSSNARTITVTNSGGIALVTTSISVSPNFSETDNCVNEAVDAGATCAIDVTFAPAQIGPAAGQVTISGNVAGGQIVIPVSGTGSTAGAVTASPGTLNFGLVQIGKTSASLPVTLENAGTSAVQIKGVSITPPFNLAANACGDSITANSACALAVTFSPARAGAILGTLTITDDAGSHSVVLSGTGATSPTGDLSTSSIVFPSTIVGQISTPVVVTLTNNGDLPLNAISTATSKGFQVSTSCGGSLGAHANCAINVAFAPSSAGIQTGTLTVSDAIRDQSISLSGTGLQPPMIEVSPTHIEFLTQAVGTSSAPASLRISNAGGAPMSNVGVQITGPSAASFSWSANTCGVTLSDGSSCTLQVKFTPASAGQSAAMLTVSSSTSGVAPKQVPLSGIGQSESGISITPMQMNFNVATLGDSSVAQIATVSNASNASASGLAVSVLPPFRAIKSSCGVTLASGASCTVGVVFTPSTNGVASGTLVVSATGLTPATAVLVGVGGAAGSVQTQPGALNFATTGVGTKSAAQTLKLTNNGPVPLASLNLAASAGFEVASADCGSTVDPGASCAVSLTFAPATAGEKAGKLTISSPSLAINSTVSLSGMGFDFTLSSSGQSSQTVPSGKAATYMLSLAPMGGSSGTFTFSCSGLPANSSCSFNPESEPVAANATGTVAVRIATGVSSKGAGIAVSLNRIFHLLPVTCALFALPLAWRSRRKWMFPVIIAVGLIGITSCASAGGGGGGTPPPGSTTNSTPAGNYSVIVTASSAGVSHKATLTLTVD